MGPNKKQVVEKQSEKRKNLKDIATSWDWMESEAVKRLE